MTIPITMTTSMVKTTIMTAVTDVVVARSVGVGVDAVGVDGMGVDAVEVDTVEVDGMGVDAVERKHTTWNGVKKTNKGHSTET